MLAAKDKFDNFQILSVVTFRSVFLLPKTSLAKLSLTSLLPKKNRYFKFQISNLIKKLFESHYGTQGG